MEPTKEVKVLLVNEQIKQVENTIYNLSIQHRVAVKVEDKETQKATSTQLEKLEKMLDELEIVIKELNA